MDAQDDAADDGHWYDSQWTDDRYERWDELMEEMGWDELKTELPWDV
jgi:ribosome assembly protein YihI (activator of Der GTPase)